MFENNSDCKKIWLNVVFKLILLLHLFDLCLINIISPSGGHEAFF